jgi:N-acetylglucosaminyldiphosphoundecaprenol N-acetyl-beta-D-mannosaminyltransferase
LKTQILGVKIDAVSFDEAKRTVLSFLEEDRPHTVFTPNPEMVMLAGRDAAFLSILNNADLVVPDGIGVVLASKRNKVKIKERVAGYDLIQAVFDGIKTSGKTVYFLGAAPGVAEKAAENMRRAYPGLQIIGVADGYFDAEKEILLLEEIRKKKPDILLVGMSMAKQEKWIDRHKNELPAKVLVGVGGSFDGMSGTVKRAPALFCKLGLEWFYRLVKQPARIKRQIYLPLFVLKVLFAKQ